MNKEEYNKSFYTQCDCSSHLLQVERYYFEEYDKGFNFSVWHYGHAGNIRKWKERFRWCWRILRTGNPWADSIIATDERALKLANFIMSELNKTHTKNEKRKK